MEIVQRVIAETGAPRVRIAADRGTLAKRRWRGVADDGREFGFDLAEPLPDGAPVFATESACYVVAQNAEPLIEVALEGGNAQGAARIGWMLGNLHFAIEAAAGAIRVPDDPAVRQALEREHVPFVIVTDVFHPLKAAAHGHSHAHG